MPPRELWLNARSRWAALPENSWGSRGWWAVEHSGAPRWFLGAVVVFIVAVLALVGFRWNSVQSAAAAPRTAVSSAGSTGPTVVLIGDSYTTGTRVDSGNGHRWPQLLDLAEPIHEVVLARYGSGYVHAGPTGKPFSADASRVPRDAAVVLVFGSRNDVEDAEDVRDAALAFYAELHARAPQAQLVAVAPPWVDDDVPDYLWDDRDALKDAAEEGGVTFVDALADEWIRDSDGLIGEGSIHPNDAGHAYLAAKLTPVIQDALDRAAAASIPEVATARY